MYPVALSKSVILFLSKNSLLGYKLISLGLQIKFKEGSGKCFHKCINIWFRINGMGCVIGVQG